MISLLFQTLCTLVLFIALAMVIVGGGIVLKEMWRELMRDIDKSRISFKSDIFKRKD